MAKRRKSSKRKSSKCPEPLNTLLDLAAGATMNVVANNMEKKYQYRKRGVPNPYRASAFGLSTGRLKSTEDIIRLGGLMGAMGSFDVEPVGKTRRRSSGPSWQYDDLDTGKRKPHSNKYAWRLNCEDGSAYGVSPDAYETKEAYNLALEKAKAAASEVHIVPTPDDEEHSEEGQPLHDSMALLYCKVSLLESGKNEYFIAEGITPAVGNTVLVRGEDGKEQRGIVLTIELRHTDLNPKEVDGLPHIIEIL